MNPFTWKWNLQERLGLAWWLIAVWTALIAASLVWNLHKARQTALESAIAEAQLSYNKDLSYRLWAAEHGGVYVPITRQTPPNPYLSRLKERDIKTPSGRTLTLVTPAYLTRQVQELAGRLCGARAHLTSLKPLNPENSPDPWEKKALEAFAGGTNEVKAVVNIAGKPYLRFMRPWRTQKSCLKCHASQGYKEGDIRGGLCVDVPLKPYYAEVRAQTLPLAASHGLIWILGLTGICLRERRIRQELNERQRAALALRQAHDELEQRVQERTTDLSRTVEQLQMEIEDRLEVEAKLQASESRFRSSFDQSPVGMVIADLDFRFKRANPAFCRITGYTAKELSSMALPDIVHPDDLTKGFGEMRRLIAGEIDHARVEERNIRKDGTVIWVEVNANLIRDSQARPLYYLGIIQDVSARKQAKEALQESQRQLRSLTSQILTAQEDERKRISMELHEGLGQCLMALKMQLRPIQNNLPTESVKLRMNFDHIQNQLKDMVEEIRRISRDLSPALLENLGLVAALKYLLDEFSKYQEIAVTADIDDIDELFSIQHETHIFRIFQESLNNIAKHAQATQVSITIKKQIATVNFSIKDNGVGFDPEQITRKPAYIAMGLSAMTERLRMIGAHLNIFSQKGTGTDISFSLPINSN
jgi:PAS domain S-box-containing protein